MRCSEENCKRKLSKLMPFECKCKRHFCNQHKIPLSHNCDFDWKMEWQNKLQSEMPKVVADKMEKIV
jgi:predicted nucleic acid binding AN1-type Zn finger protein